MPIYRIGAKTPQIDPTAWIAPNATVIGDVRLAAHTSVWWNCVLRGDNDPITVGENSNVQDGSILHTDDGIPLTIGRNVTVGHMVMLHGCTIGDGTLIGMGAIVLNSVVIGKNCLIGAGTLIPEGKVIPDDSLVVGSPGRVVHELTEKHRARIADSAQHYVVTADNYRRFLEEISR
ncbi:gamma carbonic anhydrase family protein [Sulfuricystis multivorans]|uniref:gamma carbonic anhydrase family protein n=1 Tax=Sulfuricystis multivorans TaxID=2211108 RepID=UPI000F81E868|nr:gamma carbonic anhydrase family protein [Sulfuricystis multivorans]